LYPRPTQGIAATIPALPDGASTEDSARLRQEQVIG
jgi:hypothetical protein